MAWKVDVDEVEVASVRKKGAPVARLAEQLPKGWSRLAVDQKNQCRDSVGNGLTRRVASGSLERVMRQGDGSFGCSRKGGSLRACNRGPRTVRNAAKRCLATVQAEGEFAAVLAVSRNAVLTMDCWRS